MMPLEHTCPMGLLELPSLWDMVTQHMEHMEPETVTIAIVGHSNNIWNQDNGADSIN